MKKKRRSPPPKHRKRLSQKARETNPWEASTGPRTAKGKAASSQNALKSGLHTAEIKALKAALKTQKTLLNEI